MLQVPARAAPAPWCPCQLQSTDSALRVPADGSPHFHFGMFETSSWSDRVTAIWMRSSCCALLTLAQSLGCVAFWGEQHPHSWDKGLSSHCILSQYPKIFFYQLLSWCCSLDSRTKESEFFPLGEGLRSWSSITKVVPACPDDAWLSLFFKAWISALHSSV